MREVHVGCIGTLFGALIPRLAILIGWMNDPVRWGSAFGGPIVPILGFLFLPWTTFFWVLWEPGGFDGLEYLFLLLAVLVDLGTWGVGFFSGRKQYDSYRGT
jgi:hypothetical protein